MAGDTAVVSDAPERPLRADAQRNRDRLLRIAADQFAAHGVDDVALEQIARAAEVGIGTLYRHFPTREALVAAVYRSEIERLCADVDELVAADPVVDGLEAWMHQFVEYAATKRGMGAALKSMLGEDNELFAYSRGLMQDTLGRLVTAAMDAGQIRADANAEDVLRALSGFCMSNPDAAWQEQAHRLVSLLVDGLRYGVPRS